MKSRSRLIHENVGHESSLKVLIPSCQASCRWIHLFYWEKRENECYYSSWIGFNLVPVKWRIVPYSIDFLPLIQCSWSKQSFLQTGTGHIQKSFWSYAFYPMFNLSHALPYFIIGPISRIALHLDHEYSKFNPKWLFIFLTLYSIQNTLLQRVKVLW